MGELTTHSVDRRPQGTAPVRADTLPAASKPLLICFAGDSWEGNPHSRHHLMRRFAGEFEVLFVESVPMRSVAAPSSHELRRVWRKLRAGMRLDTVSPQLHVLRPLPIPPSGELGRRSQVAALHAQIAYARRRLGLQGPAVSWFSVPIAAPLRGRLGEHGSLFYYQDRYDEFSHVDAPRLRAQVAELARGCDVCLATSDELARDLAELGAHPTVVPHGVDVDRFTAEHAEPAELADLEHPIIGHIGLLDDHLSLESIRAVAERLERGTVVLVGAANTDVSSLRHPRIVRLGFRPYDAIPAYVAAFACCLVPFKINSLTVAVNPIKLREYLAAGRPVVSAPLPAIQEYADVVEFAETPDGFAEAVIRSLDPAHDSPEERERRRRRVANESWDRVAGRIRSTLLRLAGVERAPETVPCAES